MELNGFEIEIFNQYRLEEGRNRSTCPLCSAQRKPANQRQKCLMVDWGRGLGHCCHCGETIQLHTYKKKDSTPPKKIYKKPEWKNKTDLSDKVVKYFEGRGISQMILRIAKVSEGSEWMPQTGREENTIQFNYFRDGELINIKYRDGRKNFKLVKDAEKIFYNIDSIKTSSDVVIVEGEMDVLAFMEAGIMNVVSVPNGSTKGNANLDYLDNCIDYFENKKKIYLAIDDDEPGRNTSKEMIRRLGAERCYLVTDGWMSEYGVKDANDYLLKFGKADLYGTIEKAKEAPIEGISALKDWNSDFDNYVTNGMQKGYTVGVTSFDKIFSTYTGQYIVVTGIPSSGKSDFVDWMCIGYARQYGWKTVYASPENKPDYLHAGKLISKYCGLWVNKGEYIREMWYKKAKEVISDTFKFIDLDVYNLDDVLEKARIAVMKFGVKVLVIDPYNKSRLKSVSKRDINEYTNEYLLKIDEFARKYDVLVILVAHPAKPPSTDRKGYEPTFYDVKGGGEFYDMSPHGILVHRDYENDLVKIKILKVKFSHLGENNAYCYLKWNPLNGRYIDFEVQDKKPENVARPLIDNSNWVIEKEKEVEQSQMSFQDVSPNLEFYEKPFDDPTDEEMPF